MTNVTNDHRQAFLLAILHEDRTYHGTYIREKIAHAFGAPSKEFLRGALDHNNQRVFDDIMLAFEQEKFYVD